MKTDFTPFMEQIESDRFDISGYNICEQIISIYNEFASKNNFKPATPSTTTGMFTNALIVVDSPPNTVSITITKELEHIIRQYRSCVRSINNSFKVVVIVCKYHGFAGMTTNVAIQKCPTQYFISADDDDISCSFNYLSKLIHNVINDAVAKNQNYNISKRKT